MRRACAALVVLAVLAVGTGGSAIGRFPQQPDREQILEAARAVMDAAGNCALITLDADATPQARAMDPFPPDEAFRVWMATNANTRKVGQLRADARATLFYLDREGGGYVTLVGKVRLVDDLETRAAHWKPEWTAFYSDEFRGDDYLLMEFRPSRIEVMSFEHGIAAEPMGWEPAVVELDPS